MNTASAKARPISSRTTHIARFAPPIKAGWKAGCLGVILLAACAPLPPTEKPKPGPEIAQYRSASFDSLPGWANAAHAASLRAFLAGCPKLARTAMARSCERAAGMAAADDRAARLFFETEFAPYSVATSHGNDTGLVTGYYEPVIEAARTRIGPHRHPIHGIPEDLVSVDLASLYPELRAMRLRGRLEGRRLVPYYSRAEIVSRGESFAAPVIAWTADPVELFFVQIQGSGQVRLEDGARLRIGYADQNGHPYRSLGRHLVERGELRLEEASMQGIKAWARANPERLDHALNQNGSYVFFREQPLIDEGPTGSLGVPLTAEYSLAVDRRHIPLGAPVYLSTTHPGSKAPLERLMAAQDTGGAIRGVVRADFFWGSGHDAGERAGIMRQQGRLWLLWPRDAALPGPKESG